MIYPDVVIKGLLHTTSSEYDNTFTHTKFSSLQSSHFFFKFHFKLNVMNRSFLFLLINHLYNKTQEQQQFTHNNPVSTVYTLDILSKLNTVTTYMYI